MKLAKTLMENCWNFLNTITEYKQVDDNTTIIYVPLLDHSNDYIEVHMTELDNGRILITDGASVTDNLKLVDKTIDVSDSNLSVILNGFLVKYEGEMLTKMTNKTNFPTDLVFLIQAIMCVDTYCNYKDTPQKEKKLSKNDQNELG